MRFYSIRFIYLLLGVAVFISCKKDNVNILNNNFHNSEKIVVTGDEKYTIKNLWRSDPEFIEGSYKLSDNSSLKNKGTNKKDLGIIFNN